MSIYSNEFDNQDAFPIYSEEHKSLEVTQSNSSIDLSHLQEVIEGIVADAYIQQRKNSVKETNPIIKIFDHDLINDINEVGKLLNKSSVVLENEGCVEEILQPEIRVTYEEGDGYLIPIFLQMHVLSQSFGPIFQVCETITGVTVEDIESLLEDAETLYQPSGSDDEEDSDVELAPRNHELDQLEETDDDE